jgi:hypothetical protein
VLPGEEVVLGRLHGKEGRKEGRKARKEGGGEKEESSISIIVRAAIDLSNMIDRFKLASSFCRYHFLVPGYRWKRC